MTDKLQREFARLLPNVETPPTDNTQALGHLMRQWLLAAIADSGTGVDTGAGFGSYDLWVTVGGEEISITLKGKGPAVRAPSAPAPDAATALHEAVLAIIGDLMPNDPGPPGAVLTKLAIAVEAYERATLPPPFGECAPIPPGDCTAPECDCEPGVCLQRVPATFTPTHYDPLTGQDRPIAGHPRPLGRGAPTVRQSSNQRDEKE